MSKYGFREDFNYETRLDLKTEVNGYLVSTVDLGIDHSFGNGKPLYYETMIFKKGSWSDLYCKRYSTEKEARKGHKEAIKYVKECYKNYDKIKDILKGISLFILLIIVAILLFRGY